MFAVWNFLDNVFVDLFLLRVDKIYRPITLVVGFGKYNFLQNLVHRFEMVNIDMDAIVIINKVRRSHIAPGMMLFLLTANLYYCAR